MMRRAVLAILAVLAIAISPAHAQTGLLDINKAAETELASLPNMTPAIVAALPVPSRVRSAP